MDDLRAADAALPNHKGTRNDHRVNGGKLIGPGRSSRQKNVLLWNGEGNAEHHDVETADVAVPAPLKYLAQMEVDQIYRAAFGRKVRPDLWQRKFMEMDWPEILIAPTGAGKTAGVTLGWVAHRLRAPKRTPRRLVWCLPMRTLVEQTADAARDWLERLKQAGADRNKLLPEPKRDVHVLMGGVESSRWLDFPERPAVLIGTQDMLLSRALMRGYASARAVWPIEFALLHEDVQWVFDEVQLMGAGCATSAQLEAFRRLEDTRVFRHEDRPCRLARSLWISATLDPKWLQTADFSPPMLTDAQPESEDNRLWVVDQNENGGRLRQLSFAKKNLSCADVAPSSDNAGDRRAYIDSLAATVVAAHADGRMTLVIVNQVPRAQALHAALKKLLAEQGGAAPALALIHSRYRRPDRQREMDKVFAGEKSVDGRSGNLIVISTQAVEAGVDISAAVLFMELAPWTSMVQRFGRANRFAELVDGADVFWIDLVGGKDENTASRLARPYGLEELWTARERLKGVTNVASAELPAMPAEISVRKVIRRKDLIDFFDTDPDLTGFDVDVSHYVRDSDDANIHVFWRDLSSATDELPPPRSDELCSVPVAAAKEWLKEVRKKGKVSNLIFVRDPQSRRGKKNRRKGSPPPGWARLREDLWPGLTLLADISAGGYCEASGFTGKTADVPASVLPAAEGGQSSVHDAAPEVRPDGIGDEDGYDEDPRSQIGIPILLSDHLEHVAAEAQSLCDVLEVDAGTREAVVQAARWHDLGKIHEVFQQTMLKGLVSQENPNGPMLAKTEKRNLRHGRPYFRHELASALAFLDHSDWSRDADLVAYLIAAHHGKVRMNLRALPRESATTDDARTGKLFARGVWEDDRLPSFDLGGGEQWDGGVLVLSVMELGWNEVTGESWTGRARDLLFRFGPFRLAWMETLLRIADWRASSTEAEIGYDDN